MSTNIELQAADVASTSDAVECKTPAEVEITTSVVEPCIEGNETTVRAIKKEYSVVGDGLYASVSVDEAPEWLLGIIDSVIANSLANRFSDVEELRTSILAAIQEVDLVKNGYAEAITMIENAEISLTNYVDQLNSERITAEATLSSDIVNVRTTLATDYYTMAQVADYLGSSFNGHVNSDATILNMSQTFANENAARALEITALASSITDPNTGLGATAAATQTLETYVGLVEGNVTGTGLLADVEILQKQNDGIIETIANTYDVMLNEQDGNPDTTQLVTTAEPYATWAAADTLTGNEDVRLAHIGDVYVKYQTTENGAREYIASYKFVKTAVDGTSPYATDNAGFTWALVIDQAAQDAYTQALNAYDLADGKRRVFVGLGTTAVPVRPYDTGDLWLIDVERTVNGIACKTGDILRCIEDKGGAASYEQNDWVLASSYQSALIAEAEALEDWKTDVYERFVININNQVDKKAESYYVETSPHPEGTNKSYSVWVGDLWKKPSTNDEYIYQKVGTKYKWVQTDVPDSVFDTIDGKKAIYVGNDIPSPVTPVVLNENDMWMTGDNPVGGRDNNSIYVYNGSTWIKPLKYTDDTAVNILSTGLGNGTVVVNLSSATIDGITPLGTFVANQIDDQVVVFSGIDHAAQLGMKTDDIYIEKTTATGTSGQVVDVVNTYKYDGNVWVQIGNNANITALADLADGKRTVFAGTTVPIDMEERDLWIPEADVVGGYLQGEVYQYKGTSWVLATKYTENLDTFVTTIYDVEVSSLQGQIDNKLEYWFTASTSDPKDVWLTATIRAEHNGDVWYQTDTKLSYYYVSATNSWSLIEDKDALDALTAAATAQATADGRVSSFYGWYGSATPPTEYLYWLKIDNKLYYKPAGSWVLFPTSNLDKGDLLTTYNDADGDLTVRNYNGSSWAVSSPNGIIASSKAITDLDFELTDPNGSVAGAVSALEQSLEGQIVDGVASVESKFAYNSILDINGNYYRSGFGLSSTGTGGNGTLVDPFTSEFWIDASRFVLRSPNALGEEVSTNMFTVDSATGTVTIGKEFTEATRNVFRGGYNDTLTYSPGDMVEYEGSTFLKIHTDSVGVLPNPELYPDEWAVFVQGTSSKFKSIIFKRYATQPSTPLGGSFNASLPGDGWSDGIPAEDGNPCWFSSRVFTSDGKEPQDEEWGIPVLMVDTQYVEYRYSSDNINWVDTAFDGAVYASVRTNSNGVWSAWEGYRIRGEDGVNGRPGAAGVRGAATVTASYSSTPSSSHFTNTMYQNQYYSLVIGDSIVYTVTGGSGAGTYTARYTGSTWLSNVKLHVHGDAVIDGTLAASSLIADSLDGITITGSSVEATGVAANIQLENVYRTTAIYGHGNVYAGVAGEGNQVGVSGKAPRGWGVYGESTRGSGVSGYSSEGIGMYARSINGYGVYGSSINGYGVYGSSINRYGVYAKSTSSTACYIDGDVVVTGTVNPFTGSHEALVSDYVHPAEGDILVDYEYIDSSDVSNALMKCRVSTAAVDRPIGVYQKDAHEAAYVLRTLNIPEPDGYSTVYFNAVGEGMLNVCGEGGDLQNGDLIQCSGIPGKGMRQNKDNGTPDDIIRNITVAKVRGNWDFDGPEHVRMIPCIYVCG